MKKSLTTENEITSFLIERIQKAGHHAQNVKYVVPALYGHARAFGKNLTVKFDDDGPYGNLFWFTLGNTPFCLAYNHNTLTIELRNRNQRGEPIKNFDNSSTNEEMFSIFSSLSVNLESVLV